MPPQAFHIPCRAVGCPALVPSRQRYCKGHDGDRKAEVRRWDASRPLAHKRGYDMRWHKYRDWYLSEHPLCVECEKAGRAEAAVIVDHIVPVKSKDDPLFWDPENHQSLCRPCHDGKTGSDRAAGLTRGRRE
jgi:5-methylcytosine-specific restriction enzyme A